MPLQAIEPRRLYRQIADQLRQLILRGEYALGERLPAERDLALQLGVSRPSVREALIALEVEGLVEVRVGSGIYAIAPKAAASARKVDPDGFGLFEILGARKLVEGELAAIAAARSSPAFVEGLRDAVTQMEAQIAGGELPIDGDRLFHLRVAEAADNAPLLHTVTELYDQRNSPLFTQFGQHFENRGSWRKAIAEHKAVIRAIAAGKADAARKAMHVHLQRSQDRFAEAWPKSLEVEPH